MNACYFGGWYFDYMMDKIQREKEREIDAMLDGTDTTQQNDTGKE